MQRKNNWKHSRNEWIVSVMTAVVLFVAVSMYGCMFGEIKTAYAGIPVAERCSPEYPAEFYLNTAGYSLCDKVYFLCSYVGAGTITEPRLYDSSPEGIKQVLGKVPDVSKWITSSQEIEWVTVSYSFGRYRIIGHVIEKETESELPEEALPESFASVAELVEGQVTEGQVVSTLGYYQPGDGGAADYLITSNEKQADGFMCISLKNGLKAELQISNGSVIAEQFGAYGDGIHDDVVPLQKIIDLGYDLELTAGKTYKLISNGIYISNSTTIYGNDATILLDDSYAPQKGDFKYYCIRYQYGKRQNYFGIKDLKIQINFSDNRISGREFVGVSPLYIDTVSLDGLKVVTNDSNNCIICVWLDRGCSSFTLKNSHLENNTSGKTGGALWLTSKSDEIFGIYNAIDECLIQNTSLYATSGDEVLAIWGANDLNAVFDHCTIEGCIRAADRHTRPIVVTGGDTKGAEITVRFLDCGIKADCNDSVPSAFYDSLLGIGSQYASDVITVEFERCEIDSDVRGAMLFPSGYASDTSHVTEFDSENPTARIRFSQCDIATTHPITGSSMNYYNTAELYPSAAWNCEFEDCSIVCETALAYLYMPWSKEYFVPRIALESCQVVIRNAKDFICKGDRSAMVDLILTDTSIQAEGVAELFTEQTNTQSVIKTQKNAVHRVSADASYLNGERIQEQ